MRVNTHPHYINGRRADTIDLVLLRQRVAAEHLQHGRAALALYSIVALTIGLVVGGVWL